MARKSKMQQEVKKAEQPALLDVMPKNAKQIVEAAQLYRKYVAQRQRLLEQETAQKEEVLRLVKAGKLNYVDGKIRFNYEGIIITVTPRDELITIKEEFITE
jgi:hypothetical protein